MRALGGEVVATTARSARRLAQLARAADVVHSNSLWAHLDCAVAGRLARRPVVLELHDLVRPGLGRVVLRAAVRLASSAIAVSRAVADTVGADLHGLRVIPQAVDPERFHPGPPDASWRARLSSRPDEPIVGVVGRVDPEKGIGTVVRAMAMLDGPARAQPSRRGGRARRSTTAPTRRSCGRRRQTCSATASRFVGPGR